MLSGCLSDCLSVCVYLSTYLPIIYPSSIYLSSLFFIHDVLCNCVAAVEGGASSVEHYGLKSIPGVARPPYMLLDLLYGELNTLIRTQDEFKLCCFYGYPQCTTDLIFSHCLIGQKTFLNVSSISALEPSFGLQTKKIFVSCGYCCFRSLKRIL